MSADDKVCSSQEHLVVQVGTDDFHEVEEKDDEDSDDQCAFPDKESLHLSGLSTDHQNLQSPKVELSGSSYQVFPSQGTAGFEPGTLDSIPIVAGKPGLEDIWSFLITIKNNTSKTKKSVMLDQELEAVKETQRSQDEVITSLQRFENAESQHQQEVSLLHRDLDGLAQQVQDVKVEVQNLKHAPCDHNPLISKHRTGVEQDVAFQALQKDLETSFTELSKLVTENEAALQKHEQILVQIEETTGRCG